MWANSKKSNNSENQENEKVRGKPEKMEPPKNIHKILTLIKDPRIYQWDMCLKCLIVIFAYSKNIAIF